MKQISIQQEENRKKGINQSHGNDNNQVCITGVHHLLAHIYIAQLDSLQLLHSSSAFTSHSPANRQLPTTISTFKFPLLSLLISGGHTELWHMSSIDDVCILGHTLDDAAGEALDKAARMIGIEKVHHNESPGMALIQTCNKHGDYSGMNNYSIIIIIIINIILTCCELCMLIVVCRCLFRAFGRTCESFQLSITHSTPTSTYIMSIQFCRIKKCTSTSHCTFKM